MGRYGGAVLKFWAQKKDGKLWPYKVEDQIKMNKLPQEPVLITYTKVRNPSHHRKYFAFIDAVYRNLPEKFDGNWPSKQSFRKAMQMYAGYFEETVSLKGERMMQPKSIKYEELDEMAFRELHNGVKSVIGKHIMPYVEDVEAESQIVQFYG